MSARTERLRFPGSHGGQLAARLEHPAGPPRAFALFAHCFTCGKDLKAARWVSRALADRGFAVLRFDFTGLGESEGDFADTDFSSNLDDLVAAADHLRQRFEAPRLLVGHSLGGAAVLAAARRIPESAAVATIAAPSETTHLRETILRRAPELEEQESAQVDLGGRPFRIRRQLLEDLDDTPLTEAIAALDRPLLIFHSPVDRVVGIDHARRIFEGARHPKSFVSLDRADHLLLEDPADARYLAEVLASWAGRYVGHEDASEEEAAVERGTVRVRGGHGFAQEVRAGPHRLLADEPEDLGGTDTGPNPYDLLLAGLGTCTSMTLRMYADRKEWPLERVEVTLRHRRIHADDCEECETASGKLDAIERVVSVEGALEESQVERLIEIAERCPVHRTLTSETVIRTVRG